MGIDTSISVSMAFSRIMKMNIAPDGHWYCLSPDISHKLLAYENEYCPWWALIQCTMPCLSCHVIWWKWILPLMGIDTNNVWYIGNYSYENEYCPWWALILNCFLLEDTSDKWKWILPLMGIDTVTVNLKIFSHENEYCPWWALILSVELHHIFNYAHENEYCPWWALILLLPYYTYNWGWKWILPLMGIDTTKWEVMPILCQNENEYCPWWALIRTNTRSRILRYQYENEYCPWWALIHTSLESSVIDPMKMNIAPDGHWYLLERLWDSVCFNENEYCPWWALIHQQQILK